MQESMIATREGVRFAREEYSQNPRATLASGYPLFPRSGAPSESEIQFHIHREGWARYWMAEKHAHCAKNGIAEENALSCFEEGSDAEKLWSAGHRSQGTARQIPLAPI